MVVHDGERHVSRAIESVVNQQFSDVQLVLAVMDSRDQSRSICERAMERDIRVDMIESAEERVEAALDESGMSRSEFRDYMGEMFASSGVDSFGALLDYVDMEVAFEVGDELSSSELDDLNSTFADDAGVDVEVTSGYHLSMEMTMTLLEDMNGYEAGETESQTQDVSGAYAIEIDGAWYVWMG